MATLSEIMNSQGNSTTLNQGGQLQQSVIPEVSSTSMSPLGVALAGANPNQAKMAGTPAQKQGVYKNIAANSSPNLTAIMRTQPTISTPGAAQTLKQAGAVQNLSSAPSQFAADLHWALTHPIESSSLSPQQQDLQASAARVQQNPKDYSTMHHIADLLGIQAPTTENEATAFLSNLNTQLPSLLQTQVGQVASSVAKSTLTLSDDQFKAMGFEGGAADAAAALGIPQAQLIGMNQADLADLAKSALSKMTTVSKLQNDASNPMLGAVQRAAANQQLKEAGASGVQVAQSDVDKLAAKIIAGDTVKVDGQNLTMEQLLSNSYISGLAGSYFNSPTFAATLKTDSPDLATFFDENKNLLQQQVAQLTPAVTAYADMQAKNASLGTTAQGIVLPQELMRQLYPSFGQLSDVEFVPTHTLALLQSGSPLSTKEQQDLTNVLKDTSQQNMALAADILKNADEFTLRANGLLDVNSAQYAEFASKLNSINAVHSLSDPPTQDQLARVVGAGSNSDLQATIQKAKTMESSGQFGHIPLNLEDLASSSILAAAQNLKNSGYPTTLNDLNSMNNTLADEFSALKNYVTQPQSAVYKAISPFIQNGGTIDDHDASILLSSATPQTVKELVFDPIAYKFMTPEASQLITKNYSDGVIESDLKPILEVANIQNPNFLGFPPHDFTTKESNTLSALKKEKSDMEVTLNKWKTAITSLHDWTAVRGDSVMTPIADGIADTINMRLQDAIAGPLAELNNLIDAESHASYRTRSLVEMNKTASRIALDNQPRGRVENA